MDELPSLDAVAENPYGFIVDWDEAMEANLAAVIAAIDGGLVDFVRELKHQDGGDIDYRVKR